MSNSKTASRPSSSRILRFVVILVCLVIIGQVLWQLLPKASFSSDLGQLGQGKPALVMLREIHVMGGERTIEYMEAIYPEFEDQMVFLLVHTGHPDGVALSETHNVSDGALVLFNSSGSAVATKGRPESTADLRRFIEQNQSEL